MNLLKFLSNLFKKKPVKLTRYHKHLLVSSYANLRNIERRIRFYEKSCRKDGLQNSIDEKREILDRINKLVEYFNYDLDFIKEISMLELDRFRYYEST